MKKIIAAIFIQILIVNNNSAQLTGSVFLSGQTNHAGIKAKFISTGGTSVTDSTLSDASGTYSINITGGVYKVVFSKSGYIDLNYNSGISQVLTNTTTLNNATLSAGNPVSVSGTVSGNWTNNNTYIVTGDINVPAGKTLVIQPGTSVRFDGSYSFTVLGSVVANGANGNPIVFTSNLSAPAAGNWNSIIVKGSGSTFNYCLLEYCSNGLDISGCSPVVTNNEFRNFLGTAIFASNCSSTISKNRIHDFNASWYSQGITYDNCQNIIVECNRIHDGSGYGIRPYGGGVVRDNVIYNIKGSERGYAFGCGSRSEALIENNYLYNCNSGFWIYENVTPVPHPRIINNTIADMSFSGILMHGFYASADIINNIFLNCNKAIHQGAPSNCGSCSTTPSVVANNLFWNNSGGDFVGVQITGIGSVVSTNAQNNPVDPYFNMSLDPKFVNNQHPVLNPGSPGFGAGNSGYSSDIGYNQFKSCDAVVLGVTETKNENLSLNAFPNPFNGELNISYLNATGEELCVELIEVETGKVMRKETVFLTNGSVQLNTGNLSNGIYILQLKRQNAPNEYLKVIRQN